MKHFLPELPYALNALTPILSSETLEYHWGKHHRAYVEKLNGLITGTEFESLSLEDIVQKAKGPLLNQAAQVWNHTFYWKSLMPQSQVQPTVLAVKDAVQQKFGTLNSFLDQFQQAALGVFGSGWVWLIYDAQTKECGIETTSNAENPLRQGKWPLLTIDVWEHAYYVDYRNDRGRYVKTLFSLLNWEFAQKNYQLAHKNAL